MFVKIDKYYNSRFYVWQINFIDLITTIINVFALVFGYSCEMSHNIRTRNFRKEYQIKKQKKTNTRKNDL